MIVLFSLPKTLEQYRCRADDEPPKLPEQRPQRGRLQQLVVVRVDVEVLEERVGEHGHVAGGDGLEAAGVSGRRH